MKSTRSIGRSGAMRFAISALSLASLAFAQQALGKSSVPHAEHFQCERRGAVAPLPESSSTAVSEAHAVAAVTATGAKASPTGQHGKSHDVRFAGYRWRIEQEAPGDPASTVRVRGGELTLDTPRGLTVWLATPLRGHYEIIYSRTVLDCGGPNDRVSDVNQFWLANPVIPTTSQGQAVASADGGAGLSPTQQALTRPALAPAAPFGRSGRLSDYDDLSLYYVGIGGNGNTTTRFRRYDGTAARPLLKEYLSPDYLLQPNHRYRIRTVVDGQGTRLYVDGKLYFGATTSVPESGYFAFRTTESRQIISHFSIRKLP